MYISFYIYIKRPLVLRNYEDVLWIIPVSPLHKVWIGKNGGQTVTQE